MAAPVVVKTAKITLSGAKVSPKKKRFELSSAQRS
jgi:hypothetical protein